MSALRGQRDWRGVSENNANRFLLASPADILRRAFVGKERVTHVQECLRGRLVSYLLIFILYTVWHEIVVLHRVRTP